MSNSVSMETYLAAVDRIRKLEEAIRLWASECAECGGSGVQLAHEYGKASSADRTKPCEQCADIRELLE